MARTSQWLMLIAATVALRVFLLQIPGVFGYLSTHPFFTTPLTQYQRVQEAMVFLQEGQHSVYAADINHNSPLMLLVYYGLYAVAELLKVSPTLICHVAYLLVDIRIAVALNRLRKDERIVSLFLPALYLLNPIVLATRVSLSTNIWAHLAVVLALTYAKTNKIALAALWLAVATYIDATCLALLVPLTMVVSAGPLIVFFGVWSAALLLTSFKVFSSWEFVYATYGTQFFVTDLTPNLGLFWYFFTEVFDRFFNFFLVAFHSCMMFSVLPIMLRFPKHPYYVLTVTFCITSLFKSYPDLGTIGLAMVMLTSQRHLYLPHLKRVYPVVFMGSISFCLALVFWFLWIYPQSGNANFVFFQSIIFNACWWLFLNETTQSIRVLDFTAIKQD
jgi:phosphatidylinositol glycan class U